MNNKDLKSLFILYPLNAIDKSKQMICSASKFDSFEDFTSYHQKNAKFYYCPKPFSPNLVPQLCIYCIDCAVENDDLSIMCLSCFLNGNHEGHNYFILPGFIGSCQCGDKIHIESSGFCSNHQGCDDDETLDNYLDEDLRSILTNTIFTSAFSALLKFKQQDDEKSKKIGDFIISFFQLGDGFRRLFVRAITQKEQFNDLINKIQDYPNSVQSIILNIFSYLMHDQLFLRNLSKSVISLVSTKIIKNISTDMNRLPNQIPPNYNTLFQYIFTCFSNQNCRYNIEKNWDWVTFSIELLKNYKKLLTLYKSYKYLNSPPVFSILKFIRFATSIQPEEKTQEFFDKIFTQVFNSGVNEANDTAIIESYKKFAFSSQIQSYLDFFTIFEYLMISFQSKESLKFDKLIEELDKSIDITPLYMLTKNCVGDESGKNNENDKLISRFIIKKEEQKQTKSFFDKFKSTMKNIFDSFPSKYYQSLYNGGSFLISHPLYDSFSMLFRVDDLCRVKIARFLSLEKYRPLRVKLGIIALKKFLSLVYFRMELFRIRNITLLFLYDKICETKKDVQYNMIPVSVLQLLIGLQCNDSNSNKIDDDFIIKEFFSFELAREISLFEDSMSREKEKLTFIYLYISLMLVIDRNMFNYEYKKVLEEQIIFALKRGTHSIEKLNKICEVDLDKSKQYFLTFNEILMKVARKSTKDDDINNKNEEEEKNESNINLHDFAHMKPSDDDDDDDDDNDNDNIDNNNNNDNSNKKANINNFKSSKNQKENKKENQNSYIKPVNFYLKDEIECKAISAVNPIEEQRSYLNIEISKNQNKLLKIQDFESEETYFFNNSNELKIRLKSFLFTPTILAIVYDTLRSGYDSDPLKSGLNDHLSMNILILISKFIKEDFSIKIVKPTSFNEKTKIRYTSLSDLISKLKRVVFNYRGTGKAEDEDEKAFIDNTLNPISFIFLLKMKLSPRNRPSKSIIDILMNKGQIGQDVLHQISSNIHIDDLDSLDKKENELKSEEQDLRLLQKQKASKLKEEIMNQYSNIRNQYRFSDLINDSNSLSNSCFFLPTKEVCSLCSESKNKEILCYPLYIYRTKFPFIVDKPPLVKSNEVEQGAVYDNEEDFDKDTDLVEFLTKELAIQGEQSEEEMYKLAKFKKIITSIFDQRQKEKEDLKIGKEDMKRVTLGANFVVQYGICPHPVHRSCVTDVDNFTCPIDRSMKNGFLPSLEEVPSNFIFKDMKTFELNSTEKDDDDDDGDSLSSNIVNSILSFIEKFKSFFDCLKDDSLNVFIELIKSISGLIETYEIRVRNLPDSLDSPKTKILARNLFLTVWYAYRIQKKPKLSIVSKSDSKEIDTDSRLTDFQEFVKFLIEYDDIDDQNRTEKVKEIVNSITNSIISSSSSDNKNAKRKEKEVCLFLRRVCLAEHFLMEEDVSTDDQELLDWDEVLTTENLSKRYNIKFTSIDVSKSEEFEFKPFLFANFPKEFLRLDQSPYNLPIADVFKISMVNILDYNYLIKYYDDFDDTRDDDQNEEGDDEIDHVNEEVMRYKRAVQVCDDEFLPFFMTFYGRLHYPSILMFTGALSSQIFLVDQYQGAALETFYVDRSGCPDINHVRMQPLFLNEERYEKLIDQILSGDFSYNLSSLKKKKNMFNQE